MCAVRSEGDSESKPFTQQSGDVIWSQRTDYLFSAPLISEGDLMLLFPIITHRCLTSQPTNQRFPAVLCKHAVMLEDSTVRAAQRMFSA